MWRRQRPSPGVERARYTRPPHALSYLLDEYDDVAVRRRHHDDGICSSCAPVWMPPGYPDGPGRAAQLLARSLDRQYGLVWVQYHTVGWLSWPSPSPPPAAAGNPPRWHRGHRRSVRTPRTVAPLRQCPHVAAVGRGTSPAAPPGRTLAGLLVAASRGSAAAFRRWVRRRGAVWEQLDCVRLEAPAAPRTGRRAPTDARVVGWAPHVNTGDDVALRHRRRQPRVVDSGGKRRRPEQKARLRWEVAHGEWAPTGG